MTRIRQLVIAGETSATADRLRNVLGLGEPFRDLGVGEFGLDNAVFAIGDQFLEVVWPMVETAPARRFLDRNGGEGGYMAIFETPDLDDVRARAAASGIRSVLSIEHDDISATHFHPADTGAAIISVDQPRPPGAWRWGGPDWAKRSVPGKLLGAELESADPDALAARWADLLGVTSRSTGQGARIELDGGEILVRLGERDRLVSFHVAVADPQAARARLGATGLVGGVRIDLAAD